MTEKWSGLGLYRVHPPRRCSRMGMGVVEMVGVILVGLMVSAVGVDLSFYFSEHTLLQSAADAGALAGANELVHGDQTNTSALHAGIQTQAAQIVSQYGNAKNKIALDQATDIQLGYVNPQTRQYNPSTFSTPTNDPLYAPSGGYNAVRVTVRRDATSPGGRLPSIFANLFGVHAMDVQASAVAMLDRNIQNVTGLRPFYTCKAQFEAAAQDGVLENNHARIFGDFHSLDGQAVAGCPSPPAGNWGFADFREGTQSSPGNSTISRWVAEGYGSASGEAPVVLGEFYSVQTGAAISSSGVKSALDELIANKTVITLPLIDQYNDGSNCDNGSNAGARVSGFAGFVITNYKATGPSDKRYIEGYFTRAGCGNRCGTVAGGVPSGGTTFKIRLIK